VIGRRNPSSVTSRLNTGWSGTVSGTDRVCHQRRPRRRRLQLPPPAQVSQTFVVTNAAALSRLKSGIFTDDQPPSPRAKASTVGMSMRLSPSRASEQDLVFRRPSRLPPAISYIWRRERGSSISVATRRASSARSRQCSGS
jgi:hypothetical protein